MFSVLFIVRQGRRELALERLFLPKRRIDYNEINAFIVKRTQEREVVADEYRAVEIVCVSTTPLLRCSAAPLRSVLKIEPPDGDA